MFDPSLIHQAEHVLAICRAKQFKIATVESCTGGLVAALLTEIAGSSDVVDRGFITYSNAAKHELVGVSEHVIASHGAVSEPVARAMAEGGFTHSEADLCIALTGIAGPGGGSAEKPVGLVHLALAIKNKPTVHVRCLFTQTTRTDIRLAAVKKALDLLLEAAQPSKA